MAAAAATVVVAYGPRRRALCRAWRSNHVAYARPLQQQQQQRQQQRRSLCRRFQGRLQDGDSAAVASSEDGKRRGDVFAAVWFLKIMM